MGYFAGLRSKPNDPATTKEVRNAIEESNAKNTDIMRRLADNNQYVIAILFGTCMGLIENKNN